MTSTCMHVKYAVRHTLTHMSLYIHDMLTFGQFHFMLFVMTNSLSTNTSVVLSNKITTSSYLRQKFRVVNMQLLTFHFNTKCLLEF